MCCEGLDWIHLLRIGTKDMLMTLRSDKKQGIVSLPIDLRSFTQTHRTGLVVPTSSSRAMHVVAAHPELLSSAKL
jgi:hypothetical protein